MKLTHDESRALTFVAALLLLSAGVRLTTLPDPVELPPAIDLAAHIAATDSAVAAEERAATPLAVGERVDPNTAPVVELMRLPRVGRSLAERIVAARDSAPFRSLDDLDRVRGIGPALLEGIAPHLALTSRPSAGRDHGSTWGAGARPRTRATGTSVLETGAGAGSGVIDPNTADVETLQELSGIGPALAARIVAHRDSAGPFRSAEDLLAVPGIGPATLERIRARLPGGW